MRLWLILAVVLAWGFFGFWVWFGGELAEDKAAEREREAGLKAWAASKMYEMHPELGEGLTWEEYGVLVKEDAVDSDLGETTQHDTGSLTVNGGLFISCGPKDWLLSLRGSKVLYITGEGQIALPGNETPTDAEIVAALRKAAKRYADRNDPALFQPHFEWVMEETRYGAQEVQYPPDYTGPRFYPGQSGPPLWYVQGEIVSEGEYRDYRKAEEAPQ